MSTLKFLAPVALVALFVAGVRADDNPKTEGKPKPEGKAGYLGIKIGKHDEDGKVVIEEVIADSPAAKGGLKTGDIILKMDGKDVGSLEDFVKAVRAHKPGDKITLKVKRDDKEMELKLTAGEAPEPGH